MAEETTRKDIVEAALPKGEKLVEPQIVEDVIVPEVEETGVSQERGFDLTKWKAKTTVGKRVKSGEITNIDQILGKGLKILEVEIVDYLLPDLQSDLIAIGQSKGKFGGGKRSIWRQTQKKTKEGNKPTFSALAIVGSKEGYLGIGHGKSKETVPAREKAVRRAKLNLIKAIKGCGSWECGCGTPHSIPFKAYGKVGGLEITIIPAPKGTGLCIEKECGKLLAMCGIKDVYVKTIGNTNTKLNLIKACFEALRSISATRVKQEYKQRSGMTGVNGA